MKENKIVVFVLVLLSFCANLKTFAQSEKELLTHLQLEKLNMFADYLSIIGNPKNDMNVRRYYASEALALFVNNGDSFIVDGKVFRGAQIEVVNKFRSRRAVRLVKDYMNMLLSMRCGKMTIEDATFAIVDTKDLVLDNMNGKFKATATIEQTFQGVRDGVPVYRDITRRTIQFYLDKDYVESLERTPYVVLLVDIRVNENTQGV